MDERPPKLAQQADGAKAPLLVRAPAPVITALRAEAKRRHCTMAMIVSECLAKCLDMEDASC